MKRELHDLIQGSDAWHQFRLEHDGASEAAAMLGLSKNVSRSELLRAKHTGIAKEFSDFVQEKILDRGHEVESLARPMAEAILGEEIYPATYSYGKLSASSDGLTMDGLTAWEHKQQNAELVAAVTRGELPDEHQPQCQQTMLVTGAEQVLFMVSDGTPENCVHMFVRPDEKWFHKLDLGWIQFNEDLKNYQHVEVLPPAVAAPVMALPALSIQVKGSISLIDNLALFGEKLKAFIAGIDKSPSDDQAFANAEAAVKTLQTAQDALESAEASALAQTATIDEMRRTVGLYRDLARTHRLMLEKIVAARKETIRDEIRRGGIDAFNAHIAALNTRLGKPYMPVIVTNFPGVMKGKKTIASLRDAVATELARTKIEANAVADRIGVNLNTLREQAAGFEFLFSDAAQIVLKANDDFAALVKLRLVEHKHKEDARLEQERERIRREEAAKLVVAAQPAAVLDMPQRAAALPAAPVATAKAASASKQTRPTDDVIIATVALHFHVHESQVIAWLLDMDLASASARMAAEFS